jgi:Rho family protein
MSEGYRKLLQARRLLFHGSRACLSKALITKIFHWNHSEPTVFENYVHDIFIDNVHVELSLWDTAGQEEFDRLRSLSYDDTHAIMLCFSVDSPDSLENVESKWVGEITENCPGVRLVLVALKCDLREQQREEEEEGAPNDPKRPMIDYKAGLAVAEKIRALRYLGAFTPETQW